MREYMVSSLVLLSCLSAAAQSAPSGWKIIRDSKSSCQISVPPEWTPFSESGGSAVLRDAGTAIAVVTSQPAQVFSPLPPAIVKLMDLRKEKIFENSAQRTLYQDKTSKNAEDPIAFSASVPAKGGTCSCRVVALPSVPEEIVRKIVLTLAPAPAQSEPI